MKIQINKGNGNVQQADDDTTSQIQIGDGCISACLYMVAGIVLPFVLIYIVIHFLGWPF